MAKNLRSEIVVCPSLTKMSLFCSIHSGSHTPDHYMIKGKRLKHDGDALTDSRTGRTKSGEALNRALHYFDAALCFLMGGCALERDYENGNKINLAVHNLQYCVCLQFIYTLLLETPHWLHAGYTSAKRFAQFPFCHRRYNGDWTFPYYI